MFLYKKINLRACGLFALWFFFILGPVVRSPLGSFGDLSLLTILLYLTWSILIGRSFSRTLIPFFLFSFFLSALAISNSIFVTNTLDSYSFQAILRPIKGLLILLGMYFAVKHLSVRSINKFDPRKTYEDLLLIVYAVIVIHGGIIILQFFYPPFRDMTYAVLKDLQVLDYNKQFRMPGLAGAGGAQVSAVQGLGFLIGVHLAIVKKKYLPFLVGNLLLIASFVLTGRTGFVVVGISVFYWLISVLLGSKAGWRASGLRLKKRSLFGVVMLAGLLALWIVPFLSSSYESDGIYRIAIDRTFETFFSFKETGHFSDRTLSALGKMLVFPDRVDVFSIGDARLYNNTTGVYASDLGYIRLLWGYGLIGLLGHVVFYLLMGFFILKPCVKKVMGSQNVIFGLFFLGSILVLNFKEVFFFTRMIYPITLTVVMGLYWLSYNIAPLRSFSGGK